MQLSKFLSISGITGTTLLAGLAAACSSIQPEPPAGLEPAASCSVLPGAAVVQGSGLTVALNGEVDPHNVFDPVNFTEQVVFDQVYETLVNLDCTGRAYGGLARRWESDGQDRRWTFHLRQGARFADGEPLTAEAVLGSWRLRDSLTAPQGRLLPFVDPVGESIRVVDDSTIEVVLRGPNAQLPSLLAAPRFRIVRAAAPGDWFRGSRRFEAGPDGVVIFGDSAPVLEFLLVPQGDERDLVDGDADVLLLRDPAAVSYARALDHGQVIPLDWDRTYVLLSPLRAGDVTGDFTEAANSGSLLAAVSGDVRVPAPGFWLNRSLCGVPDGAAYQAGNNAGLVYPGGDRIARDLAERLVALAGEPRELVSVAGAVAFLSTFVPFLKVRGAVAGNFDRQLREGSALAYVLDVPASVIDGCGRQMQFARRAPWLFGSQTGSVFPLATARPYLFVREAAPAVFRGAAGRIKFF